MSKWLIMLFQISFIAPHRGRHPEAWSRRCAILRHFPPLACRDGWSSMLKVVWMWWRRHDWQQKPFQFSTLSTNSENRWILGQKCTRLHSNDLTFHLLTISNWRGEHVLNLNTTKWNSHKYTELEINKHFPQLSPLYLPAPDRADICMQSAGAWCSFSPRNHSKAIFFPPIELQKMLI